MASLSAPGFAQQLPAPGQLERYLPPLAPPPTPVQAAQADQRQGAYADINGTRIFYQVAGQGTPLLLIHGFPLSGQLYQGQLAGLRKYFTVITPDLRGFGKSLAPDGNGSIQAYAQDMLALLDHLGVQSAVIGGHSMGGQITLDMYKEQPARFAGMLLIDTDPMAATVVEQGQWQGYREQGANAGVSSIVPIIEPPAADRRHPCPGQRQVNHDGEHPGRGVGQRRARRRPGAGDPARLHGPARLHPMCLVETLS